MADLVRAGNLAQFETSSANSGSIAALFAAPFAESLDFPVEFAIVGPLSWAIIGRNRRRLRLVFCLAAARRAAFCAFCLSAETRQNAPRLDG